MSLSILRSPMSRVDVLNHAYRVAEQSGLNASDQFLKAVEGAYQRLADMPGLGAPRDYGPDLPGLRMWAVPKFRSYLIFYQATEHQLIVRRVLHGAQDISAIFNPPDEGESGPG